jgi:hypothetical protein
MDPALPRGPSRSDAARAVLAAPALPLCVFVVGLVSSWRSQSPEGLWTLFGAIAGYSLSGST